MKKDRDIFLPDTTVKLSSLKRVLNEVYELDIIELNKMDKKKQGGTLNSSVISFTQDDYNRLMDSNIFSSNKGERVFTISPKDGGRHLAKYNPDKQYLFVLGNKDLSNPIVKWLSENSYISDNENYKLADGGTIDNQMENKLWYDIEKGIPHSFAKGGAISEGKAYGDWLITQYTPLTYDDLGGAHGGMIKLVNQDNFDTIIIWNDKALRSPKWSISYNNARIEDKNPSVVIEKVLKSYGNKKYYGGGDIGYENYIVEFKKGSETRRIGILAHSQQEAVSKAKKMIGKGYSTQGVFKYGLGGTLIFLGLGVAGIMAYNSSKNKAPENEYKLKTYKKGTLQDTYIFSEAYVDKATQDFKKLGYVVRVAKIKTMAEGGGVMSNEEWRKYTQPKIENLNKLLENGSISFEQYQYALSNLQNPKPYSTGGGVGDEVYIEFLNKDKGFKKDVKHFKSYEEAVKWARKNFEKFNPDMIKHKFEKGGSCGCGSKFEKGGNTNCVCWHYEIGGL